MSTQQQSPAKIRSRKPTIVKMRYAPTDTPSVELPRLRLSGQWFREAGFLLATAADTLGR
jgi:hypothetical protein